MTDKGGVTGRGMAWEILNSWWIAFSVVSCSWIGFFIIGSKAKQKKWKMMGVLFLILQFGVLLAVGITDVQGILSDILVVIWLGAYVSGIILSFTQRKEYLLCRDVLINVRLDERNQQKLRNTVIRNYEQQGIVDPQTIASFSSDRQTFDSVKVPEPARAENRKHRQDTQVSECNDVRKIVDINSCSESDLVELPGISVVLAKKAITYREEHQGFRLVEEFFTVLEIKPHFMVQLKDRIKCGEYRNHGAKVVTDKTMERSAQPTPSGGRKLDF